MGAKVPASGDLAPLFAEHRLIIPSRARCARGS